MPSEAFYVFNHCLGLYHSIIKGEYLSGGGEWGWMGLAYSFRGFVHYHRGRERGSWQTWYWRSKRATL